MVYKFAWFKLLQIINIQIPFIYCFYGISSLSTSYPTVITLLFPLLLTVHPYNLVCKLYFFNPVLPKFEVIPSWITYF